MVCIVSIVHDGASVNEPMLPVESTAPTASTTTSRLVAQAKFFDQSAITGRAFLAKVSQKPSALSNHHHETATRVQVMLMDFEMLGHLIDAPCQDRDLDFWRAGISLMNTRICNNFCFFFECQCHASFFTSCWPRWERKCS